MIEPPFDQISGSFRLPKWVRIELLASASFCEVPLSIFLMSFEKSRQQVSAPTKHEGRMKNTDLAAMMTQVK